MIKTYTELSEFKEFEDRYLYLRLFGVTGEATFGYERHLNQTFYKSREWRDIRLHVIARDLGTDLGAIDFPIHDRVIIHHMNPITPGDIYDRNVDILDPEFLITTSHNTHNAIHYGDSSLLPKEYVPRYRGDTALW